MDTCPDPKLGDERTERLWLVVRISVSDSRDSSLGSTTNAKSSDNEVFVACGGEVPAVPRGAICKREQRKWRRELA